MVLVLDDDKDLLEMVGMILTNYNIPVYCINDGAELFSKVEELKPTIILMDIFLGNSDGRDLCLKLKSSPEFRHIPVILYSAGHIIHQTITDSKANEFMVKPFDIKQLVSMITSFDKELQA